MGSHLYWMEFLVSRFFLFLLLLLVSQVVQVSLVSDVLWVVLVAQVFHDMERCWSIEVGWVL